MAGLVDNRVTVDEAAAAARCSVRTITRAASAGALPTLRAYGRLWIDCGDLQRWIVTRQTRGRRPNGEMIMPFEADKP
jgi:hypothetical protein